MQYAFFTIPATDSESGAADLNSFLRAHRVLSVKRELVADGASSFWAACVEYLDSPTSAGPERPRRKERVDYKAVLSDEAFARFARLRQARREIAQAEAIPAFAVFTDAHLAEMAKLDALTLASMKSVRGIGDAKVGKYGERVMKALTVEPESEEGGKSV